MPGRIQSVDRAVAIVRLLQDSSTPLELHEVAAALGLARSTAHGLLATLRELDLVAQSRSDDRYYAGVQAGQFIAHAVDGNELRSLSMNWTDSLVAETGLQSFLGIRTGGSVELVHHVFRPDGSRQHLRTGERLPLHATALGKALLANDIQGRRALSVLDLQSHTHRTVVDAAELAAELVTVRRTGLASEDGEFEAGRAAVAAPIRGAGGKTIAAIAVVGPRDELIDHRAAVRTKLVAPIRKAAAAITDELGALA